MSIMQDAIHWAGIVELGQQIRGGRRSARDLTEALISRICELDEHLGAYAQLFFDEARLQADRADKELDSGNDRGPLHGIPVAIKDLCGVEGKTLAAGTRVRRDVRAETNCTVVERLQEAGAVILGSTVMTEGAYSAHHPDIEPPRNPWDAERWSGVSSSGSGAATAAGLCVASIGTDTGGSIRFPSAVHGLTGLKPTYGRVSRFGVVPLADSLDHIGPIARSVEDVAFMLRALAGADPKDPTASANRVPDYAAELNRSIEGLRIGFDRRFATDGMNAGVVGTVLDTLPVFENDGAQLCDIAFPPSDEAFSAWPTICAAECAIAHAETFPSRRDDYGPVLAQLLDFGLGLSGIEVARAHRAREIFAGQVNALMNDVDVILCPAIGIATPGRVPAWDDIDTTLKLTRFTGVFDLSRHPALTLPCGFAPDGMPVGMQLVGRHMDEVTVLRVGAAYQRATDWHRQRPPI